MDHSVRMAALCAPSTCIFMVAPSASRDAKSKIPPGPEGSNGIDGRVRRGPSAGPPPFCFYGRRALIPFSIRLRDASVFLLLVLLLTSLPAPAQAAMSLNRTRLIVTAQEREATIDVRSEDESPILLQTWVDDEMDPEASSPDSKDRSIPFITDPPMFRIDPKLSRQVRVLLVQPPESLPQEHETLFWFNAHETPTRPPGGQDAQNYIQLAFHVRIKLFYRPAALADYTLSEAHKLRFSLGQDEAGQPALQIRNPAPIHQSLGTLVLMRGDERIELEAPMLTPDSQLQLPITASLPVTSGLRVVYSTIADDGALLENEQAL